MNDKIRTNLDSGQRCRQWTVDYASLILAGSLFETKTQLLTTIVGDMETLGGGLEAAKGEGRSATDVKGSERDDLIEIMEKVRRAARAAEEDHPGTRDRYRYNVTLSHQDLLAAGRSFAAGGAADSALLQSYSAPNHWPDLVTAACNQYEASFGQQDSAKGSQVAHSAELKEKSNQLTTVRSTIGHMIPNVCEGNPGAIAAWNSAAHVEKAPQAPKPPPTPPTP